MSIVGGFAWVFLQGPLARQERSNPNPDRGGEVSSPASGYKDENFTYRKRILI